MNGSQRLKPRDLGISSSVLFPTPLSFQSRYLLSWFPLPRMPEPYFQSRPLLPASDLYVYPAASWMAHLDIRGHLLSTTPTTHHLPLPRPPPGMAPPVTQAPAAAPGFVREGIKGSWAERGPGAGRLVSHLSRHGRHPAFPWVAS